LPVSLPILADLAAVGGHELIVVDDGSDDGTVDIARTLLRGVPGAAVVRLPRHRGKGAAVRAGVAHAGADAIVFLDADLATDPTDLPVLLAALDHAHIAVGSRAIPGSLTVESTAVRVHAGRLFNTTVRALTRLPLLDTQCGFKAFRHNVAKLLFGLQRVDGLAFDVELLTLARRFGFSVIEVPDITTSMVLSSSSALDRSSQGVSTSTTGRPSALPRRCAKSTSMPLSSPFYLKASGG